MATSMAKAKPKALTSLTALAAEINKLYAQVENAYMRTGELLHTAREHFEDSDDDGFMAWATEHTKYTSTHVNNYLRVYERVSEESRFLNTKNPIPFMTLRELVRQEVPKKAVSEVIRKFNNQKPPTREDVKRLIREAQPEREIPVIHYARDFAARAEKGLGSFSLKAEFLLDLSETASAETVRLVARHWKNKYHPDRGGDAKIFDMVVKAETVMLKKRGEK